MSETRPPLSVTLEWDGELQFTGQAGKHEVSLDGSADAAATPVQLLALSLAGCMAIDLIHILARGRHPATSLKATFTGERSADDPKRFTKIALHFVLTGSMQPEHVERAIQLSRTTYCSVWNSLRQDIGFDVDFAIEP